MNLPASQPGRYWLLFFKSASTVPPGNVRELKNFIQRATILSPGKLLRPPSPILAKAQRSAESDVVPLWSRIGRLRWRGAALRVGKGSVPHFRTSCFDAHKLHYSPSFSRGT
jgi:transcriptional regulator with AAA-type ATPase domain